MKILHINRNYEYGGGTELYLLSVMNLLEKQGHEQSVVYSDHSDKTLKTFHRRTFHLPEVGTELRRPHLPAFRKILKDENPDIIYLHNVYNTSCIELCTSLKPTVRYIHDPSLCCFIHWKLFPPRFQELCTERLGISCFTRRCLPLSVHSLYRFVTRKKELRLHHNLAAFIVASEYMKNLLLQNGFSEERIEVIPYFVNTPPLLKETAPAGNKKVSILYAGLMHRVKGVDLLLRALAHVKEDFHATFAGTGPHLKDFRSLAKRLKIADKVRFSGWVSNEELMHCYKEADIVVVPSLWVEAFCIVGIEAMSAGRAVVAFNTGGISDWLKHEQNGLLVPRGDINALSSALERLIENPELRDTMGRQGRKRYEENYTSEQHITKLLHLLNRIQHHV